VTLVKDRRSPRGLRRRACQAHCQAGATLPRGLTVKDRALVMDRSAPAITVHDSRGPAPRRRATIADLNAMAALPRGLNLRTATVAPKGSRSGARGVRGAASLRSPLRFALPGLKPLTRRLAHPGVPGPAPPSRIHGPAARPPARGIPRFRSGGRAAGPGGGTHTNRGRASRPPPVPPPASCAGVASSQTSRAHRPADRSRWSLAPGHRLVIRAVGRRAPPPEYAVCFGRRAGKRTPSAGQ
jgi:hypothetical protein